MSNINGRTDGLLKRIANILLLNASLIKNPGLLNGKIGIAIFLFHYSRYTNCKVYEEYAGELIDEVYDTLNINSPLDFANGQVGIGWGIDYLIKNNFIDGDPDEVLAEIDNLVYINSHYLLILPEYGANLFGSGLYYIRRIRHHVLDHGSNPLFCKKFLPNLVNYCERLINKFEFPGIKGRNAYIDGLNSIAWFLIELKRTQLTNKKLDPLFYSLLEHYKPFLKSTTEVPAIYRMKISISNMIPYMKNERKCSMYKELLANNCFCNHTDQLSANIAIDGFIKMSWQNLIYGPEPFDSGLYIDTIHNILSEREERKWKSIIDSLNEHNLSLTGIAGLGLGLLSNKLNSSVHSFNTVDEKAEVELQN